MAETARDWQAASRVADIYRDAELRIMTRVSAVISQGLDAPDYELRTLARTQQLRAEAIEELRLADEQMANAYERGVRDRYERGNMAGFADLSDIIEPIEVASSTQRAAVERLQEEMARVTKDASSAILRTTTDSFRAIVGRITGSIVARGESRRAAAQRAVDEVFSAGESEFRDSAGRRWRIPEYVEMATRTSYARAQVQGHEDALQAVGLDLVIVQPGPRACKICDRWARAILSRNGQTGTVKEFDYKTGGDIEVTIDATLEEARGAKFQHPNCRCTISAFIPGVTKRGDIERPPWDEKGYDDQQRQREIEKQIRELKRKRATALSPEREREMDAKIAAGQARMKQHLEDNPELKRQSDREQISGRFGTPDERAAEAARRATRRDERATRAETAPATRTDDDSSTTSSTNSVRVNAVDARLEARFGRGAAESMRDATITAKVNPRVNDTLDYQSNCHNVVSAVELRARGYDVIARPTVNQAGRPMIAIARDWETESGATRTFTSMKEYGSTAVIAMKRIVADMPNGARGFMAGSWKNQRGAGHVFSWAKKDDRIFLYDGQIDATAASSPGQYPAKMQFDTMQMIRVDDLNPSERTERTVQGPDEGRDDDLIVKKIERARAELRAVATDEAEALAESARLADERDDESTTEEREEEIREQRNAIARFLTFLDRRKRELKSAIRVLKTMS